MEREVARSPDSGGSRDETEMGGYEYCIKGGNEAMMSDGGYGQVLFKMVMRHVQARYV